MFDSFVEYLAFQAKMRPEAPFGNDADSHLSYAEAWQKMGHVAARLQARGITKGDRVAILSKNSLDNFLVFLGCARAGVVPVGINYRLTADEVGFIAEDADVRMLFVDGEFAPLIGSYLAGVEQVSIVGDVDGAVPLNEWLGEALTPDAVTLNGDDVLFQMYTSGTTGLPKGTLLTHRNLICNSIQAPLTTGRAPRAGDRALIIAPTFHALGLVGALMAVYYGCELVLHRDYDPIGMIETMANENITYVSVVPVMLQFSLACIPDIEKYEFPNLRWINYGASPISVDLLKRCLEVFDCEFYQGYGQTESTTALTFLTNDDHMRALQGKPELLRSCGRAVFGTELRIVDDKGNTLPTGEVGEILGRGPQVMKGYWKREEATAKTVVDGWLHTGDAGYLDEDGYLFIKDRVKDLIISGGENIYPAEVENVLMSHPKIADAAVIGVPDEKWGEVPLAVLVAGEDGEITVDEMVEHCRSSLAGFKTPKLIEYVAALPRNPSGKILKKELRASIVPKYQGETA
ncbi:MAG: long-chain-fatty-acid--CoA ligase [Spongiibacter marinus]|uniref:long-chain-fatty-acid--CoA ligase n=1 Tax=Spongiibacter TaxID=630749 RepID=UPI000C0A8C62|nr:long-chain-fatty-acid--CoA ligase [Spongiibacter sp.]MAK43273.1 acyl-CoA synthetase [Spongiibacter sp.]|tara:strand:+ start:787 stop:2340 length:1554 start_codon:yes stop_codon:yes gene_type:complete